MTCRRPMAIPAALAAASTISHRGLGADNGLAAGLLGTWRCMRVPGLERSYRCSHPTAAVDITGRRASVITQYCTSDERTAVEVDDGATGLGEAAGVELD